MSKVFRRGFKSWCETASKRIRHELDLTPYEPLDPLRLAKHIGIKVWQANKVPGLSEDCLRVLLKEDPDSWSAVTIAIDSQNLIILNSVHSKGRQSNTISHEISHIILDHVPARVDVSEMGLLLNTFDKKQEQEADWLAGTLLLPRDALLFIKRQYPNLKYAARIYGVSFKLLEYRMSITGVNKQYNRFRRSNARN